MDENKNDKTGKGKTEIIPDTEPGIFNSNAVNYIDETGQFAFYRVPKEDDPETVERVVGVVNKQHPDGTTTTVRVRIEPDENEDITAMSDAELFARVEDLKRTAATQDNSGDQITDPRKLAEYRKRGLHVVTNAEIASGKFQTPAYQIKQTKINPYTAEIEFMNGEKIVMTDRQYQIYVKFNSLYLFPGLFNYNDLRRILDVVLITIGESAAELEELLNRYSDPNENRDELQAALKRIETLTGIKITGVNNGSVDFNITVPTRTAHGLLKYPAHEFLTTALTAANLAHNYTPEMNPKDVDERTKQINELLARRSNRTTTAQIAVDKSITESGLTVVDITRSTMIIKHQTKTKETVIEIPFTKALISKHSNYYAIWFELVGMITRDINFNTESSNAEVGEIVVPYKYFAEIKLYSRTSDAKSAIYKNDDFTEFINNISGRIKQLKTGRKRNNEPLKRANAMFTNIDFYDNYFTVQYSKRFNWNILYEYFAPFPENWQELNPETKSLLIVILMHWRRAVGGTYFNYFDDKYNNPAEILKEVPTSIKLLNRTIQQQCIGRSEDTASNPTRHIKNPIIENVNKLNKWFEETQPENMQLKIEFEKPTGYGSIGDFLDHNGIIVTFGSAYLDYGAEILTKQRDAAQERNRIKKEKERAEKKKKTTGI